MTHDLELARSDLARNLKKRFGPTLLVQIDGAHCRVVRFEQPSASVVVAAAAVG